MPLSEYEQRVLEELERDLGADPKLGSAMSRTPRSRGRLTWAVLGVIVGLAVVLTGAMTQVPMVGIAGFALMIFAALWALLSPKPRATAVPTKGDAGEQRGATDAKPRKQRDGASFMRRVEERFDRRREQGDL